MKHSQAVILSCEGPILTDAEKKFFASLKPFGFIFFGRNVTDKVQLKKLCADCREAVGWDCPILIDQEGGRVRRMRPPVWNDYPSMKEIGDARDENKLVESVRGICHDLHEVGIDVDCAPVLDVLNPSTHDAIGTRAFSADADLVGHLGALAAQIFVEQGITPVIKHMPGQGRSALDSHYDLPRVTAHMAELEDIDFKPFLHVLAQPYADHVWGMVSHIIYDAVDVEDPASVSAPVINLIRERLGFSGLLLSDDLCMNALAKYGSPADRVAKTLEAGMDIALYCAGKLDEMEDIARVSIPLRPESIERYERSRIRRRPAA